MDPNTLSSLDPKLRETYEKVMGGAGAQPAVPQPAAPGAADAAPGAPTQPTGQTSPITPPAEQSVSPAEPNQQVTTTTSAPADQQLSPDQPKVVTITQSVPNPTPELQFATPQAHGHMGLIKVFYILGATVFFVIYIFFWLKIFNVQLPF